MAKVEIVVDMPGTEPEWAPPKAITSVLAIPKLHDGPSPRGSTYWTRFLTCPREARLAEILAPLRPSLALSTGFAWHLALEIFYASWLAGKNYLECGKAAFDALEPLAGAEGYGEMYELLCRMLTAYLREYESDFKHWKILAVEETLGVTEPMQYTARLDLVIIDTRTNAIWPVEHKSAKALNASIIEGYQLALQIMGQAYLFEKCVDTSGLGGVYSGVNVSITTKHAPSKRNPELQTIQFARLPVLPSPEHLRAFEKSIVRWTRIRDVFEKEGYPPDFSKCSGYARGYSKCQFYKLCYAKPDMDLDVIEGLARKAVEAPGEMMELGYVPASALTRHLEERNAS